MSNNVFRNPEGYYDPTAGAALSRVAHAERRRPLVYICSKYAGDVESNVRAARRYCKFAVKKNVIPVASHLLYPQFLDDNNPYERSLGLLFGKVLLDKCKEVWIFGSKLSPGMKAEYERAVSKGKKIRYFTEGCKEVDGDASMRGVGKCHRVSDRLPRRHPKTEVWRG